MKKIQKQSTNVSKVVKSLKGLIRTPRTNVTTFFSLALASDLSLLIAKSL